MIRIHPPRPVVIVSTFLPVGTIIDKRAFVFDEVIEEVFSSYPSSESSGEFHFKSNLGQVFNEFCHTTSDACSNCTFKIPPTAPETGLPLVHRSFRGPHAVDKCLFPFLTIFLPQLALSFGYLLWVTIPSIVHKDVRTHKPILPASLPLAILPI